jgi:hypothetical protein
MFKAQFGGKESAFGLMIKFVGHVGTVTIYTSGCQGLHRCILFLVTNYNEHISILALIAVCNLF